MKPFTAAFLLAMSTSLTAVAADGSQAPTIKSATKKASSGVTVQKSGAGTITADTKLENYRRELELNPDPKTRTVTLRRIADIEMQLVDEHGPDDPASKPWLDDAISIYEKLLQDEPLARQNDSVLYQLARAYRMTGREKDTVTTLVRLVHDFPESGLVDDARFMSGELLFSEHRYREAENEFAPLVRKKQWAGELFEPAQYKLAWTLFDEDDYEGSADVFIQILDRLLPKNAPKEPDAALATVDKNRTDVARDSLRGLNLCFIRLGGPKALNDYFEKHKEPRFSPTLYISLGDAFLEKRRYTDAAETYETFVARHPNDPDSPVFETRTIAAYTAGGFSESVLTAKGHFAEAYDPSSPFWKNRPPSAEVMSALHQHLEDLAKYHHELAQKDPVKNRAEFGIAADWYRKILKDFPDDPHRAETNLALADALLEGGDTKNAADEYMHSAYDYPVGPKSAEAAYAAVQTYEKYLQEAPDSEKVAARKLSADAAMQLADHFPEHPEKVPVLTRAAEELYAAGDLPRAIDAGSRVIAAEPPAPLPMRRSALAVVADAQFAQQHYVDSEKAYAQLLQIIPASDPQYKATEERHTASIYKAADAARDSGDLSAAAQAYERLGATASSASVRAKADFDAAATYMTLKDWANAEKVLETYPARHPESELVPDADKKLAVAYQNDHKLAMAAVVYQRIAQRPGETAQVRQDSSWLVAQLYDQAGMKPQMMQAYQAYLAQYPKPFDKALEARERLAELHKDDQNQAQYEATLRDIITADANAGAERTDKSRALASRALLAIGRMRAAEVDSIHLIQPLKKSIPKKKQALQVAIDTLTSAANGGFADVATAATFELGNLYRKFGRSLIDSEKPPKLSADALEQYNLLLEEQAEPFDEKAIQTYEVNLQRIKTGVYDDWIAKSAAALAEMAPAKYGKLEQKDTSYDQAQ